LSWVKQNRKIEASSVLCSVQPPSPKRHSSPLCIKGFGLQLVNSFHEHQTFNMT
jgi:hypothetical protein